MRGVAVTGIGIVSCLGRGLSRHLSELQSNDSKLQSLSLFDVEGIAPAPVGEVSDSDFEAEGTLSRCDSLALAAAKDALADAGISNAPGLVALGITTGGILSSETHYLQHRGSVGAADRNLLRRHIAGCVIDKVAERFQIVGERQTFSTACSSSANAIGYGAMRVTQGAPFALVGGVDSLSRLTYSGFHSLRLLSKENCRPFDVSRQGLSLGEGAAFLVLESEEIARKQGKRIYARVSGWGCAADAYHMTAPHPEGTGAISAIRSALTDAELNPEQIGYINAHGTATPANDKSEAFSIRTVFSSSTPWVSSTKSRTGHTLGAAGAIEAVFSILALTESFLPSTLGLRDVDADCALRHVPIEGVREKIHAVLSSSFGFGGNNSALVFRSADS